MAANEDEVKLAKAAGHLQYAISLLTPKLKEFIRIKLADQISKMDFSQSIRMILNNWDTLFPGCSRFDMSLFKRAKLIRNLVSHQVSEYNRFQRNLECLANVASFIKKTDMAQQILSPYDDQNRDTARGSQKNGDLKDEGLTESESQEPYKEAKACVNEQKKQTKQANEAASQDEEWINLKEKGNVFFKKGNWMEAMNFYTQAIHSSPNQAVLYSNRALAEINLKKYQLAREDAEDAIRIEWKNVEYYRILSEALVGLNLHQEAINVCEEGLKLDPRDAVLLIRQRDCKAVVIHADIDKRTECNMGKKQSKEDMLEIMSAMFTAIRKLTPRPEDIQVCENVEEFVGQTRYTFQARQYLTEKVDGMKKLEKEKKALELFETAAKKGSADGLFNVALMYSKGRAGLARDFVKSNELCREAASQKAFKQLVGSEEIVCNLGVAEAENCLGVSYRDGMGLDQDDAMAFQWFLKSAEHSCPLGQLNLGSCLLNGIGCRQDLTSARQWFQKAADLGVGEAQYNYASMLMEGQGGPKDEEEALRMLRLAAKQGIPDALAKLQLHLRSGAGRGLGSSTAKDTILNLTIEDNPEAVYLLGINYWKGEGGFGVDLKLAEEHLKKASELGHSEANCRLGQLLIESQRNAEAVIHVQKAAELGMAEAQWVLGCLQAIGDGCARDERSARRWLRRAQQQGVNPDLDVEDLIKCSGEVVAFETENRLPIERLSPGQRLERYMCSKAKPDYKTLADRAFELLWKLEKNNQHLNPRNSTWSALEFAGWIPWMMERAETGSETAKAFFEAHDLIFEAERVLRNGQPKRAFQMARLAHRIWSFPLISNINIVNAAHANLSLNPNDSDALFVVVMNSNDKSVVELLLMIRRCVELDPSVPDFHHFLGCMYGFSGQFEEGLRCFERALQLLPEPKWIFDRASALSKLPSKKHEAIKAFEEFLLTSPPDGRKVPDAFYTLAYIYFELDQKETARQFYGKGQRAEEIRLPCFRKTDANFALKAVLRMCLKAGNIRSQVSRVHQSTVVKSCGDCNKPNAPFKCSSCKSVFYCDSKCQKSHWKNHKKECRAKLGSK